MAPLAIFRRSRRPDGRGSNALWYLSPSPAGTNPLTFNYRQLAYQHRHSKHSSANDIHHHQALTVDRTGQQLQTTPSTMDDIRQQTETNDNETPMTTDRHGREPRRQSARLQPTPNIIRHPSPSLAVRREFLIPIFEKYARMANARMANQVKEAPSSSQMDIEDGDSFRSVSGILAPEPLPPLARPPHLFHVEILSHHVSQGPNHVNPTIFTRDIFLQISTATTFRDFGDIFAASALEQYFPNLERDTRATQWRAIIPDVQAMGIEVRIKTGEVDVLVMQTDWEDVKRRLEKGEKLIVT